METLQHLLQMILHIDESLIGFVSTYGVWTYVLLFAIIFCETGLVVFPFLPGDSLLFAAGSLAAHASNSLSIQLLFMILVIASILGNKANYFVGRLVGPRIFQPSASGLSRWLHQEQLIKAHSFYEKHGGKTIIFARFIPFFRTFVPFIAGVSYMSLGRFSFYNVVSGIVWIGSLLLLGFFFGNLPIIKDNFSITIYAIIGLTLVPPALAFFMKRAKLQA